MSEDPLVVGKRISISSIENGKIAEATLIEVNASRTVFKILEDDGREFEFGWQKVGDKEGWKMLFEDPMQPRVTCFSQRAPFYTIEEVELTTASV